ncbi:MAG TPA: serine hydrolase [Parapedobacter sp.]|uniref:serine hydrolase n=1 Tax=Parapedobacter sp. TaxID=1958893 RepID=UPI002B972E5B|nr:serine hydrolase [Parapedobacter sp.]HWK58096.1 serine hydrolase [Parapedobacter sp.]
MLQPQFNKYPKPTDWNSLILLTQQAFENGFRGTTVKELINFIVEFLPERLAQFQIVDIAPGDSPVAADDVTRTYQPTDSGTYTNFLDNNSDPLEVDLTDGFVTITGNTQSGFKTVISPIDLAGYATKEDVVGIQDQLIPLVQTIGADSPDGGTPLSPNYTRIMLTPVDNDGTIKKVSFNYSSGSTNTLSIKIFNKTSVGTPGPGATFEQDGDDTHITPVSGLNSHEVSIAVQEGQYIGFFCYSGITSTEASGLFGSPQATGSLDEVTLQFVYSDRDIQIRFDLFDETTTRLDVIEQELADIVPGSIAVVPDVPQLPAPVYGRSAIIPVFNKGAAWSDGKVWRWYRDNQPVEFSWNHVLGLAQQDGWKAVFGVDNPYRVIAADSDVQTIEDGLDTFPDAAYETAAPGLVTFINDGPLSAEFTGTEKLLSASVSSRNAPLYIVAVYSYDEALTGSEASFLFDGRTANERAAIHATNGNLRVFSASDTIVAPLDNLPHITGFEMNGSVSGRIYHDSVFADTHLSKTEFTFGRFGADYQGSRGWKGKLAVLLVYEGAITADKIHRMNRVLSDYYGVARGARTISADAYSTMRLSDKSVSGHNGSTVYNIASITKLMTLTVASGYIADYAGQVTVQESDVTSPGIDDFVQEGDVVTFGDLFASALIVSDNNAPIAIAREIGYIINPSATDDDVAKEAFISAMNDKATALGMDNTAYTLPWTNGMSTANDQLHLLAHIQAIIPSITSRWGLIDYEMVVTGANARTYMINNAVGPNTRGLLPEFLGGKTGTVDNRGSFAFVWSSESGMNATVVLRSNPSTERYIDSRLITDSYLG